MPSGPKKRMRQRRREQGFSPYADANSDRDTEGLSISESMDVDELDGDDVDTPTSVRPSDRRLRPTLDDKDAISSQTEEWVRVSDFDVGTPTSQTGETEPSTEDADISVRRSLDKLAEWESVSEEILPERKDGSTNSLEEEPSEIEVEDSAPEGASGHSSEGFTHLPAAQLIHEKDSDSDKRSVKSHSSSSSSSSSSSLEGNSSPRAGKVLHEEKVAPLSDAEEEEDKEMVRSNENPVEKEVVLEEDKSGEDSTVPEERELIVDEAVRFDDDASQGDGVSAGQEIGSQASADEVVIAPESPSSIHEIELPGADKQVDSSSETISDASAENTSDTKDISEVDSLLEVPVETVTTTAGTRNEDQEFQSLEDGVVEPESPSSTTGIELPEADKEVDTAFETISDASPEEEKEITTSAIKDISEVESPLETAIETPPTTVGEPDEDQQGFPLEAVSQSAEDADVDDTGSEAGGVNAGEEMESQAPAEEEDELESPSSTTGTERHEPDNQVDDTDQHYVVVERDSPSSNTVIQPEAEQQDDDTAFETISAASPEEEKEVPTSATTNSSELDSPMDMPIETVTPSPGTPEEGQEVSTLEIMYKSAEDGSVSEGKEMKVDELVSQADVVSVGQDIESQEAVEDVIVELESPSSRTGIELPEADKQVDDTAFESISAASPDEEKEITTSATKDISEVDSPLEIGMDTPTTTAETPDEDKEVLSLQEESSTSGDHADTPGQEEKIFPSLLEGTRSEGKLTYLSVLEDVGSEVKEVASFLHDKYEETKSISSSGPSETDTDDKRVASTSAEIEEAKKVKADIPDLVSTAAFHAKPYPGGQTEVAMDTVSLKPVGSSSVLLEERHLTVDTPQPAAVKKGIVTENFRPHMEQKTAAGCCGVMDWLLGRDH